MYNIFTPEARQDGLRAEEGRDRGEEPGVLLEEGPDYYNILSLS